MSKPTFPIRRRRLSAIAVLKVLALLTAHAFQPVPVRAETRLMEKSRLTAESRLTVENEFLRITLAADRSAYIDEFISKSQGRNLVAPIARLSPVPMFQVDLYRNGTPTTLGPAQADKLDLARIDSQTIELRAYFRAYGLTVRQRLELKRGYATGSFSMGFKLTEPGYRLGVARLPGLGLLLDAGPEATVLLPIADGALLRQPIENMKNGEKRTLNYPGMASIQLLAAYDKRGGLLAFTADGRGDFKMLVMERFGKQLVLTFENVLYHLNPPDLSLPYTVEIGAFEGGWERAADVYKLWAVKQSWCRTLLKDRKSPSVMGETRFTLGVNLREGGKNEKAINRIPEIPSLIKGWSAGLMMPMNAMLLSWEKHGPWIAPDYFPPYGGEAAFKSMVDSLHGQNHQSMAFLSGFNVTLDKTIRPGSPAFKMPLLDEKALDASAIAGADGKPLWQGRPNEATGRLATLCPSTAAARKGVAGAFRKLSGYGIDRIQIDQVVGGGTPPCFSPKHGHPVVGGHSMFTSTASLLDSLAGLDPSVVISLEGPGELFIPHVHQFHARDYMENAWPRDGAGISGVSLFNYIYHEYSLGYGGDTAPIARKGEDPAIAIFAQAMNLINGRSPAAAVWMKIIPFGEVHDAQKRFMQDAASIWKGPAGVFLRQGELLPLDHQSFPVLNLKADAVGKSFDIQTSKLFGRAFRLADGRTAVAYVNITGEPLPIELRFASGRKRVPAIGSVLWPVSPAQAATGASRSIKSGETRTLPPYGILFIETRT